MHNNKFIDCLLGGRVWLGRYTKALLLLETTFIFRYRQVQASVGKLGPLANNATQSVFMSHIKGKYELACM